MSPEKHPDLTAYSLLEKHRPLVALKGQEYFARLRGIFLQEHSVTKRIPTAEENRRNQAKFILADLTLRSVVVTRKLFAETLSDITHIDYAPFVDEEPVIDLQEGYWAGHPLGVVNHDVADAYNVIRSYALRGCPPQQTHLRLLMSKRGLLGRDDPLYLDRPDIEVEMVESLLIQ